MTDSLEQVFEKVNRRHFDGFLDPPVLRWNSRLRSSAGRFIPGSRMFFASRPSFIEVASYLQQEESAAALIEDTMAHEMIHYWLWVRRRPYGHGSEFHTKMKLMGVSRYNPVPKTKGPKYVYQCPVCETEFPTRRKLGVLACARCCREHSHGKFDSRFKLEMRRQLRS